MDINLARHMIRVAFRSSAELQGLLRTLKEECGPDEYKGYAMGIASAVDAIGVNLTNKALGAYPQLAKEIEDSLDQHGRYV